MLKIIHSIRQLDFDRLMAVYAQSEEFSGSGHSRRLLKAEQQLAARQNFYFYLRDCFFAQPDAFYALWVIEDTYCSALRIEPYRDGLLLAGLETAPEERGKGYATALVREVLQTIPQRPLCVYSHVDKNNTPSIAVHERCGFFRILDYAALIDGSVLRSACTYCYEWNENMPALD